MYWKSVYCEVLGQVIQAIIDYPPPAAIKMSPGATIKLLPGATTNMSTGATTKMSPGAATKISLEATTKMTTAGYHYKDSPLATISTSIPTVLKTVTPEYVITVQVLNMQTPFHCHIWFCKIFSGSETLAINKSVASHREHRFPWPACPSGGAVHEADIHDEWDHSSNWAHSFFLSQEMARTFVSSVNSFFLSKKMRTKKEKWIFLYEGYWWAIDFEERKEMSFVKLFY